MTLQYNCVEQKKIFCCFPYALRAAAEGKVHVCWANIGEVLLVAIWENCSKRPTSSSARLAPNMWYLFSEQISWKQNERHRIGEKSIKFGARSMRSSQLLQLVGGSSAMQSISWNALARVLLQDSECRLTRHTHNILDEARSANGFWHMLPLFDACI